MKKQLILWAAARAILLSACKKDKEEVSPNYSSSTSELTASTGTNGNKGNCTNPPPPPEKVIADLDQDKDGKISKAEAKGPLLDNFDKIDANKDGFITLDEMKAACPKQQPLPPPQSTQPSEGK
jgi:hypothetical protein